MLPGQGASPATPAGGPWARSEKSWFSNLPSALPSIFPLRKRRDNPDPSRGVPWEAKGGVQVYGL